MIVLRNPAERALALYCYMIEHGYEWHSSFERALAAEDRRFKATGSVAPVHIRSGTSCTSGRGCTGNRSDATCASSPATVLHHDPA